MDGYERSAPNYMSFTSSPMRRFIEGWHSRLRRRSPSPAANASAEWRCEACRDIPWDLDLAQEVELLHHESFAHLEASAVQGCVLCRVLWTCLAREHPDMAEDDDDDEWPCSVLLRARSGLTPRMWYSVGVKTVTLALSVGDQPAKRTSCPGGCVCVVCAELEHKAARR